MESGNGYDLLWRVMALSVPGFDPTRQVTIPAWDDADILKEAGTARTVNGAICKVAAVVKVLHSYAEDIRATAF